MVNFNYTSVGTVTISSGSFTVPVNIVFAVPVKTPTEGTPPGTNTTYVNHSLYVTSSSTIYNITIPYGSGCLGGGGYVGGYNYYNNLNGWNGGHGIYVAANSTIYSLTNYGVLAGGGGGGGAAYYYYDSNHTLLLGGYGGCGGGGGGGGGNYINLTIPFSANGGNGGDFMYHLDNSAPLYNPTESLRISGSGGGGAFGKDGGNGIYGGSGSIADNSKYFQGGYQIGGSSTEEKFSTGGGGGYGGIGVVSYADLNFFLYGNGGGAGGGQGGPGGKLYTQPAYGGLYYGGGGGGSGGGQGATPVYNGSTYGTGGNGGWSIYLDSSSSIKSLFNSQGATSGYGPLFIGAAGDTGIVHYYITINSITTYGQLYNNGNLTVNNFNLDPKSNITSTGTYYYVLVNIYNSLTTNTNTTTLLNNGFSIIWSLSLNTTTTTPKCYDLIISSVTPPFTTNYTSNSTDLVNLFKPLSLI